MKIAGFTKTTLLDYPDHLAATIFTSGCNMRCPFCHNGPLVLNNSATIIDEDVIFEHLVKRLGILEGICITGGEPTIHEDLPDFISKIKFLGFKVKLDTNGSNPAMINYLINEGLIDYIAMDIKNTPEKYAETVGISDVDLNAINLSIDIIKEANIPYQFRTTVVKEYHTFNDIIDIAKWLQPANCYVLQTYRYRANQVSVQVFSAYTSAEMDAMKDQLSTYIKHIKNT